MNTQIIITFGRNKLFRTSFFTLTSRMFTNCFNGKKITDQTRRSKAHDSRITYINTVFQIMSHRCVQMLTVLSA